MGASETNSKGQTVTRHKNYIVEIKVGKIKDRFDRMLYGKKILRVYTSLIKTYTYLNSVLDEKYSKESSAEDVRKLNIEVENIQDMLRTIQHYYKFYTNKRLSIGGFNMVLYAYGNHAVVLAETYNVKCACIKI